MKVFFLAGDQYATLPAGHRPKVDRDCTLVAVSGSRGSRLRLPPVTYLCPCGHWLESCQNRACVALNCLQNIEQINRPKEELGVKVTSA